MIVICAKN